MTDIMNIKLFNTINAYAGQNIIIDKIAIILAEYLPFIFIAWLVFLWIKEKRIYKDIVLWSSYTAIIGVSINFLITAFYFHPRPFMMKIGTLLIHHGPETSFPSDHTTFMMSIAVMLISSKESRVSGIMLVLLSVIGGISRVFCGLHFPLDIFGSLVVSLIACVVLMVIKEKLYFVNNFIVSKYKYYKIIAD